MRRQTLALTVSSVLAIVVTACGLPQDSKLERVRADDAFGLSLPTSSTTTSTTTTTTTIPASTVPEMTTTSPSPSTEPPVATEQAKLYFVLGDKLFALLVPVTQGVPRDLILSELLKGVPELEATAALRTLLPETAVVDFEIVDGTGFIELSPTFVESLPQSPNEQALAFGQMVMTVLKGESFGQVVFTYQGTGYAVVDGSGTTRGPDEKLTVADYSELLLE